MTALAVGVRELNTHEIDQVSGGWVLNAAGAVIGGVLTYADRADDGDMTRADWAAVAAGAAGGAIGGGAVRTVVRVAVRVSR